MMFTTVLLTSLFTLLAAANSLSFFGGKDQRPLEDTYPVPGENPLDFCQKPDNYSLTITNVDLTPNPPSP